MKIEFYPINQEKVFLKYVVLQTRYKNQWVFVRHCERTTWEIPGGHIEPGETPDEAAKRELNEETGAVEFTVEAVCDYSVDRHGHKAYGRLYYCDIEQIGELGDSEIAEVTFGDELPENMTYAEIQPYLFEKVMSYKKG